MCYIFNCFGWALDVLQRVITFFLACLLSGVVCLGLAVAIAAGIAYGYNYSMAEFLSFTKSDVTVYMRRGQFYDRPDIDIDREMFSRRSNDADNPEDEFNLNKTSDYQDVNLRSEAKALPDVWKQVKDTRKYAEVLTKYSPQESVEVVEPEVEVNPPIREHTSSKPISITLNPLKHTKLLQSGSSQIVMRNFLPLDVTKHIDTATERTKDDFYQDIEERKVKSMLDYVDEAERKTEAPDIKIRIQDPLHKPNAPIGMRHWRTTERVFQDYTEVDEENIVYKPV